MSSQANITLSDGQATPVAHTFVAAGVDSKGVAKWFEKTTSAIVSGFFTLTSSVRIDPNPTKPVRIQCKLVIPTVVTETINGVSYEKVHRQMLANIDIVLPGDSTLQERKDLVSYLWRNLETTGNPCYLGYSILNLDPVV